MPPAGSPRIPSLAESPQELLHPGHQIRLGRLKKQMEMIPHQHPGMDLPSVAPAHLPQPKEETLPILVVFKNRLPPIPTRHHVIHRPGILMSQRSWHAQKLPKQSGFTRKMS
jgi:hypothetical protein